MLLPSLCLFVCLGFFFVYECFACMYICAPCVSGTVGGQRRMLELDSLELEYGFAVSYHVGARN